MVKLTVLYGHPDDPAAFEEYYANTHMPLVDDMPNLQRYEAARACYELGQKSHRNADFTVSLVPSRSLFPAFLSRF
jgi:uncharacterized protein (TIGR02118 family)